MGKKKKIQKFFTFQVFVEGSHHFSMQISEAVVVCGSGGRGHEADIV